MSGDNKVVHFMAGAISGTMGSIVTCPLDVAKTRLQSSRFETYRKIDNHSTEQTYNKTSYNKSLSSQLNNINNSQNNIKNPKFFYFSHEIKQKLRCMSTLSPAELKSNHSVGIISCIRYIIQTEGYRALFKGLLPTLVGVAPARAIYFTTYEYCKKTYSASFNTSTTTSTTSEVPNNTYQNALIHLLSAGSAGVIVTTITNPIWMIRTRLQLNNKGKTPLTTMQCIRQIQREYGYRGFYKGLTASYFGVIETAIHFVIYEAIKARIVASRPKKEALPTPSSSSSPLPSSSPPSDSLTLKPCSPSLPSSSSSPPPSSSSSTFKTSPHQGSVDGDEEDFFDVDQEVLSSVVPPVEFLLYMLAASTSKTIATFLAYPHEVARTRMREGNPKYTKFFGTLVTVAREEGSRALYRGLLTQLVKHIPNTAIVLTTYEAIVYLCHRKGW